jgi:hypothetical protein
MSAEHVVFHFSARKCTSGSTCLFTAFKAEQWLLLAASTNTSVAAYRLVCVICTTAATFHGIYSHSQLCLSLLFILLLHRQSTQGL